MTKTIRNGIIYFFMIITLVASLITIRPAEIPSPSSEAPSVDHTSAALPGEIPVSTEFELKLTEGILYFSEYAPDGHPIRQETIDYIDIYSLYQEQLQSLEQGITFKTLESAAEFIQDLGS